MLTLLSIIFNFLNGDEGKWIHQLSLIL